MRKSAAATAKRVCMYLSVVAMQNLEEKEVERKGKLMRISSLSRSTPLEGASHVVFTSALRDWREMKLSFD